MEFGNYKDSVQLINKKNSGNCNDFFCTSPFVKYVLPSFLVVLLILISSYFGLISWLPREDPDSQATCHLQASYYVACSPPRLKITRDQCLELGCCWRDDLKVCYHSFPSRYGYKLHAYDTTGDGIEGNITAAKKYSPAGEPMRDQLSFSARRVDENHFQIALKTNTASNRGKRFAAFREPMKTKKYSDYGQLFGFLPRDDEARISEYSFDREGSDEADEEEKAASVKVLVQKPHFSLSVVRGDEEILLSTSRGPLIMTDNYWELTLYLASGGNLRGLHELELNGTTNWIYNNENQTARPILLGLSSNVACRLHYQGPLELRVLNGSNLVILRGISLPDSLTFDLYTASSPLETIRKLSSSEQSSHLLSFDRLGLHLCPDHHEDLISAVESLRKLVESSASSAPWDSHCLSRRNFALALEHEAELSLVAEALKILDARTLAPHLTPMLFDKAKRPLQLALEKESCVLGNGSASYVGIYESQGVVYPDWTMEKTREISREFLDKYVGELQLGFIVLRDAWPRDEMPHKVPDDSFHYLPKTLGRLMSNGSIPYDLNNGQHYKTHNSYAESFANFVGSRGVELRGHECNSPNVEVGWPVLRSIFQVGVIEAMTGRMPTAMYVCGASPTRIHDELCVRWYALAVAWPRIMAVPEKSPFVGSRLSRNGASQVAKLLKLRATLTTYHRTAIASFAKERMPILAVTELYFPDDNPIRNCSQFFWGDSILVGVVLLPRHFQVAMWLPGEHPWRHLQGGSPVGPSTNGSRIPVTVNMGQVVLLVRPGRVVAVHQEAGDSSAESSLKSLNLLANPICESSSGCRANGRVYFGNDEATTGEFLLISYSTGNLSLSKVLEAKQLVCGLLQPTQTSILTSFQILGRRSYTIDLDLCKLQGDVAVELNER